jgi:peptidyl-prolyl cis-trans isomerase C
VPSAKTASFASDKLEAPPNIIMKVFALSALCLAALCAQTAPPQQAKPPALPDLPDSTPVASFDDGYIMTMGEMRGLLNAVANPQALANIQGFLDNWAQFRKMARMAKEDKLDEDLTTKTQLLYATTSVMAQAEMNHQGNPITSGDEVDRYYEDHKANYQQVKAYAIYIAFSNSAAAQTGSDGKKILSEVDAKAKTAALLEQIRKGAEFKKLAKENSDDETSRAKDGFFGDLKPTDPMPDSIRTAIFKLKAGETTDVIYQPNGFYLFRVEEVTFKPFKEVRDQVDRAYKDEHLKAWFESMQSTKATILNPKLTGK